jgi:hypothetical protein
MARFVDVGGTCTLPAGSQSMSTAGRIKDPIYWRQRAIQTRADADQTADIKAKLKLLEMADFFDRLAVSAETKLPSGGSR